MIRARWGAALDHSVDDIYVAEMYSVDVFNVLSMTDLTTFVADDLTNAKIKCEAWISYSPGRRNATHVRLRRQSRVIYLRAISAALRQAPRVHSRSEQAGRFDLPPSKPDALFDRRVSALRALAG